MRALVLLVAAALATGCEGWHPAPRVAFAFAPSQLTTYLRYRVESSAGAWTREFEVSRSDFAERRTTRERAYSLGLRGEEAWMRVGTNPPVEIDGALAADERRDAAWIGMRFADPEPGASTELESCRRDACTFVHVPRDGHALWVDVDRATQRPSALSWVTGENAVDSCDEIAWSDVDGAPAVKSATCSAIVDHVGRETTRWTLEERRTEPVLPAWAQAAPEEIVPLRPLADVAIFPVRDPSSRVFVPVSVGGSAPLPLVLDTGSPWTVLTRRALDALGVVPSPDPPLHVRPPFLPEATYETAIVDRFVAGDVELHGVRVLVVPDDGSFAGEEAGLLGMDLLSRFAVDVDGPASTLRLWPRGRFVADDGFVDVPYAGVAQGRVIVSAEVGEIGEIPLIVDTGAPFNVIVGGPAMHRHYPHRRGEEVWLAEGDQSSDYVTEIDGFRLGPFAFPRMPAYGHDRRPEVPFLDDDGALVGLGVLRHLRVVVDAHASVLHLAAGPSYAVLARFGVEIDERGGAPTVARTVETEHAWRKAVREGDVVRAVNGKRVTTRDEALVAIASCERDVRLTVERNGNRLTRALVER